MINIITDDENVKAFLNISNKIDEDKAICILTKPENIEKYKSSYPIIIWAKEGIDKYPILKGTHIVEELSDIDEEYITRIYNRYYGISNVVMITEHLNIREITINDLPELYELYKGEGITNYMEGLYEEFEEEVEFTKAYIENMYGMYDFGLWIVEEKNTGKMVGRCGLSNRAIDGNMELELGYMIGTPFQRKGYAFEACMAILDFAKKTIEKEDIFICTDINNLPSISLAKKLSFEIVCEYEADNTNYLILKRSL